MMNINSSLYYQSAYALKLPIHLLQVIDGFEVRLGRRRYFFRGGATPFNDGSSLEISDNKYCTNKLLEAAGFPVPKTNGFSKHVFHQSTLESLTESFHFPLVVKPTIGTSGGQDVLCNITNMTQLKSYMKKCYRHHKFLSIEEFHGGLNSYRVLIFYHKVIGVVQRFPARVVGDGLHTISQLIAFDNIEREKRQKGLTLGLIKVDEELKIRLKELSITCDTIPKNNEMISLCYTCNSARGGTMESLGKKICSENARLLCQAARVLNLNLVGFDVLCEDILIPIETSRGVIIEANQNPDISIHENPMFGQSNRVSKKILRRLIFRHPIAYVFGLLKNKHSSFYIKSFLIFFALLVYELLF